MSKFNRDRKQFILDRLIFSYTNVSIYGAGTKDSNLKFRCNLDEYNKFADLNKRLTQKSGTHEILLPNLGFLWKLKS